MRLTKNLIYAKILNMYYYKSKSLVGTILVSGLFLGLCYVLLRYVPGNENGNRDAFGKSDGVFVTKTEKLENGEVKTPFSVYSLQQQSLSAVAATEDIELSGLDLLLSAGFEPSDEGIFASNGGAKDDFHFEEDVALSLYRRPLSRPAVEWFYTHITGNRDVAKAVLENADKNDIPPSLAFALAYVESRYKVTAINKNTNGTIDRGLFQLNDASFTKLSEEEFFNPAVSAKFGMSHFRYCLDVAGNEITALAMYNAGTARVKNNSTPQHTLNYVAKISQYRKSLERQFAAEVAAYYDSDSALENAIALAK